MGVAFKGYPEIAELLLAHGADINLQHGNGGTALMFAVLFGRHNIVRVLMPHGPDLSIRDIRGLTVTDIAVQQGNVEALEIMEEYAQL